MSSVTLKVFPSPFTCVIEFSSCRGYSCNPANGCLLLLLLMFFASFNGHTAQAERREPSTLCSFSFFSFLISLALEQHTHTFAADVKAANAKNERTEGNSLMIHLLFSFALTK